MVHKCNGILLSHKKEQNNAICSNMGGPRDYHTKWSQTEKDKYMVSLICGIYFFKWYKWTYLQTRKRLTDIKTNVWYQRVNMGGKDKPGVWD